MAEALKLLLIGCLLHGALCEEWKVVMPKTMKVMSGSCVTIPCSFNVLKGHTSYLDSTCKAVWKNAKHVVMFDSSNPEQHMIQGHLTGNLLNKNCDTTLNNMQPDHSSTYIFRLECNNPLILNYPQKVRIDVTADPPTPTVSLSSPTVKEGNMVTLKCSAPAPCLSAPPTLTWTPSLGHGGQETLLENLDKTKVMTSVLTFTASHLHHGKEISCSAAYNKQDGSNKTAVSRNITASVSYSPKNIRVSVSPSGPVPEDTTVTLTCSSDANPAATSYTWYRTDGGQDSVMGNGVNFSIQAPKAPFFCEAANNLGHGRSNITQIDVQYPMHHYGLYSIVVPWAVAGVSLIGNVFCIIYMILLRRKARQKVNLTEEERTYMSLYRRDMSPEYDVIGQTLTRETN